ncbi:3-dehydroquinate synthase [Tepiditoga spiralis]|uniref:3-dehydroquinate synthase n=1 Tax=Tepiditoga spiralis TaxID=2108365 RepID=A0A7G1G3L0_9BACT|nr:3-dehydroquinate synthase [Tepiditoga spiralis]BBE31010.1 3-dehydroquinate synthase [Tepiditoga spiralis]
MKTINIIKNSKIYVGESLENVHNYIKNKNIVVITDENIKKYYELPFEKIITLKPGEKTKKLKTIEEIAKKLIEYEVDRSSFLLGIGGGVVSDITGFVGSIYMRGLKYGFVSTTLLSQVDASIGGKNGVNFYKYKNILGTINQPEFVLSDLKMLKTLSDKEYRNGLSEVIKYGLILDKELLNFIEKNIEKLLMRDEKTLEYIVHTCSFLKSKIVNEDEKENGIRKILNFGHTFGHAIERIKNIKHGEAISVGMMRALQLSKKLNFISDNDIKRIEKLLKIFKLPTEINISTKELMILIKKDKKRSNDYIDFILLKKIGEYKIQKLKFKELEEL